jgi:hypothetical protein
MVVEVINMVRKYQFPAIPSPEPAGSAEPAGTEK